MCIVCIDFMKNKLTLKEARRNLEEMARATPIDDREGWEHLMDTLIRVNEDIEKELELEKEREFAVILDQFED